MTLPPGSRLGPYEVSGPLGAGGMGEVYRAHDARLHRDVAIKVLPASFAGDPARMARFAREAQVLAALSHANIAAIYGLEESGGASALVMELVEGSTLAERIAQGPVPVEEAVAIARQIAEALEAAHEKGIVHRDLKPANVKITPDGKVKVLDFGLAKAMDADPISGGGQANSPTLTLESTRMGQIMGTAAYMSPEQARGRPVDKRADIWAFGVVLHEMLTGQAVFEGETVSDTLAAVLRADLDWKRLPPATPPKLLRLLRRCLERDPKRRLRDIGDAWIELDAPDEPVAAAAPPTAAPLGRQWLPWAAAALIAGAGIAWGLLRPMPSPARPTARWVIAQKGPWEFVDVSRDGSRLAYSEGTLNNIRLVLRSMDQFEGKPLPGGEGGFFPVFSPDGQWILFSTQQSKLKKIPVSGGTPVTLCDGNTVFGAAWIDDDTIVFAGPKGGLVRVGAGGGTPEQLTTVDQKKGETGHVYPQALPDGRVLFTVGTGPGWDTAKAAVLDLKSKTYRIVAPAGATVRYVPTGHLVYARGGTLFALPFELKRMAAAGSEAAVIEGVSGVGPPGFTDYAFSSAGLLIYISRHGGGQSGSTLAWADRKGATEPITTSPELWGTGRLSPDGSHIANGLTRSGGGRDIWNYDIARKTSMRLTFEGNCDFPVWTADGRRLLIGCVRDDKGGIYSVPADGSAKPELVTTNEKQPIPTSMSPDGKTLLFTETGPEQKARILVLPTGGPARPLHDSDALEGNAEFSPDGKWVAYESWETRTQEVYVQPFPGPGGKVRISTNSGVRPRWARSGRELFYWEGLAPTERLMAVDVKTSPEFQAGVPRVQLSLSCGTTWDVAPDGRRFLVELTLTSDGAGARMEAVTDWFDELRRRAPAKK